MAQYTDTFGIYVHIPYCRRVCSYCDFNVYLYKRAKWSEFIRAVVSELSTRGLAFNGLKAQSIYFGGGTPSLAPAKFYASIMEEIKRQYIIVDDAEITVEVDPATLTLAGYQQLKQFGVNRISLGWQSSHDAFLKKLGRGHTAVDSEQAYHWARQTGFNNISLDLLFAIPDETMQHLECDLANIARLAPDHVSLYALTYHEGTDLYRRRQAGRIKPVSESFEAEMMLYIEDRLAKLGYEHYEVSNYARAQKRSKHNQLYWHGGQYLGVGPGAHSFKREAWHQGWRWETRREPTEYIEAWLSRKGATFAGIPKSNDYSISFVESLDTQALMNERLLLSMRLSDGIDISELANDVEITQIEQAAIKAQAIGWLKRDDTRLLPTSLGLMNADALALMLM